MGHEHNRMVAWVRFWGALAAQLYLEGVKAAGRSPESIELAESFARFERNRFELACHAFNTTKE